MNIPPPLPPSHTSSGSSSKARLPAGAQPLQSYQDQSESASNAVVDNYSESDLEMMPAMRYGGQAPPKRNPSFSISSGSTYKPSALGYENRIGGPNSHGDPTASAHNWEYGDNGTGYKNVVDCQQLHQSYTTAGKLNMVSR